MPLHSFANFKLVMSRHRKIGRSCAGSQKRGALGHGLFGLCVNPTLGILLIRQKRSQWFWEWR